MQRGEIIATFAENKHIMDFEGKVLQILQPTKGTSSRGEWQRQEVIFEMTQEFSRKVAVTFFNKPADVEKLRVGESYIVSACCEVFVTFGECGCEHEGVVPHGVELYQSACASYYRGAVEHGVHP